MAHIYPRLAPTCEWDTAAAHAIVEEAGGVVLQAGLCDSKGKLLEDWKVRSAPVLLLHELSPTTGLAAPPFCRRRWRRSSLSCTTRRMCSTRSLWCMANGQGREHGILTLQLM